MKINAYAKINLMLNILGKRPDNYHEVDMIMQTIGLCDVLHMEKIFSGIELSGTGNLPYDETNLAYKAAKLFFDVTGIRSGVRIYIQKNIPTCAGMAGGSADCAAVLNGLNAMYGKVLNPKVLSVVSASLGADVPFCLKGGTARAQGIGDIITPISPLPSKTVVVVKPPIAISTPKAYGGLDLENLAHPDTEAAVRAIEKGDVKTLYTLMGNSFEKSIFRDYPEIESIKSKMRSLGADASLMSGSGSAVFGIFEDESLAKTACETFKKAYKETYLTKTNE